MNFKCLYDKYKITQVPGKIRATIYLALPILVALSVYLNLHSNIPVNNSFHILIILFFIFVFMDNGLKPYIYRKIKISEVITGTLTLFVITFLISILSTYMLADFIGHDPQGLDQISISGQQFINRLPVLMFNALGEEYFKVLIFLGLLAFIKSLWRGREILVLVFCSFIFAILHAINWPVTAVLTIALVTIPYYLAYLYYRNLIPLIIVHFLYDALAYMYRIKGIGPLWWEISLILLGILSIGYILIMVNNAKLLKN